MKEEAQKKRDRTTHHAGEITQYLMVGLYEERFLVALQNISKITNPLEIYPLPDTPDFILGVANFSGEILPILDLRKLLRVPGGIDSGSSRLLVCKHEDVRVGFTIDAVYDTCTVVAADLKTDTTRVQENDYIVAELILKGETVAVVDVAAIISDHRTA